jgi:hypothetical protein
VLEKTTDDRLLNTKWRILAAGKLMSEQPRNVAIRDGALKPHGSPLGQLTVYLRLNDEKVPVIYPPSGLMKASGRYDAGRGRIVPPVPRSDVEPMAWVCVRLLRSWESASILCRRRVPKAELNGLGTSASATYCAGSVTVLVSNVIAAVCVSTLPSTIAPVWSVTDWDARIFPLNNVKVPRVAELPTCQKMLDDLAPLSKITRRPLPTVSVEAGI